jgi:hypothetical protein
MTGVLSNVGASTVSVEAAGATLSALSSVGATLARAPAGSGAAGGIPMRTALSVIS